MTRIDLKYVQSFTDRLGHPRNYFRRHGKTVTLPGLPGSREFMDAYSACLADQPIPAVPRASAGRGTFAALATTYYGSANYLALSTATRRNYRRIIDLFLEEHGHRLVTQMERRHVVSIVGRKANTPGAAITLLKRIRTLTRFAVDIGWINADPARRIRAFKSNEFHTWTEQELAQFEEYWPVGSKPRLGFALHLYTGQRGSDVHRMTWSDVSGGAIGVTQIKTGAKLLIPLHTELQKVLAIQPKEHVAILTTEYGRPFTVKGFGQFMSKAIQRAGLPSKCKSHGLRKAAARRLAEAGCSSKEIAAITGHKTLAEVERYTIAADQKRLARQAIEKQEGNRKVSNFGDKVSNLPRTPQD